MRSIHETNGYLLIGVNAVAGAWCLAAYRWQQLRGRPVWGVVIVGQVLALLQAVFGALLANQSGVELNDMHALYGFSAVIAVAILYSYRSSTFMRGKELMLYGFGCWFIMGLGLRNLVL